MQCPVVYIILHLGAHHTFAIEQQPFELSTASEHEHTITSVLMQSVILPCKAILLIMEPERVRKKKEILILGFLFFEQVMWYKITNSGQSPLSVGKYLITKDPRISVAYYSFDHGLSPAKWDLHITDIHLSDAARYQCHVVQKDGRISARSNVKLVVEGKIKIKGIIIPSEGEREIYTHM
jgi:hypothetical protein